MILDGKTLTPTELILLHIQLETEDVRDDDTLRLVSMVSIAVSKVAPAPRATPSQAFAAALHGDEGRSVALLERPLLAFTEWQDRMVET